MSRRTEQILAFLGAAERPLGAYDLAKLLEGDAKPVAPVQLTSISVSAACALAASSPATRSTAGMLAITLNLA